MINLTYKQEEKKKEAFYCSDYGRLDIDLYFGFVGETKTNPPKWNETLKWGAGKGAEEQMLKILKMNGKVHEDYEQEFHGRVDMQREGVEIHGYIDALTTDGYPIEIKTINNANKFDIEKYQQGKPRDNYVGQLAMYMDFLEVDKGYLFVASIDGLNTFWFECKRIGNRKFECGQTVVDLNDEYKRWNVLYNEYVLKKVIPECPIRYKIPVEDIDWVTVSKTDIGKARNGHKVIGDPDSWKLAYSDWKDKILDLQGATLGYTDEELEEINKATKGYTTR
jgi:hypothetical protein